MKVTGYTDDNGTPRKRIEYDLKKAWDMIRLEAILEDPSAGVIKESFDDEKAVITVDFDW
jgi:hypothetical protein